MTQLLALLIGLVTLNALGFVVWMNTQYVTWVKGHEIALPTFDVPERDE